jgi:hypothetical protein
MLSKILRINKRVSVKYTQNVRYYTHRIISDPSMMDINKLQHDIFDAQSSEATQSERMKENASRKDTHYTHVPPQQVSEENFRLAILEESLNHVNEFGWSTEAISHVCKSVRLFFLILSEGVK